MALKHSMKVFFILFIYIQLYKFYQEKWRNMARATNLNKLHVCSFQPPQSEAVVHFNWKCCLSAACAAGRQWDVPLHTVSLAINQSLTHSSQGKQLFGPSRLVDYHEENLTVRILYCSVSFRFWICHNNKEKLWQILWYMPCILISSVYVHMFCENSKHLACVNC